MSLDVNFNDMLTNVVSFEQLGPDLELFLWIPCLPFRDYDINIFILLVFQI